VCQLLQALSLRFCVDATRQFIVGESNGGMLVHFLIQSLPGLFAAAAPVFASPLLGYLIGSKYELITNRTQAHRTSILQLHDRSDTVIPWQGGATEDGWLYESVDRSLGVWAAVHGCGMRVPIHTAIDGGAQNTQCWEYQDCRDQKRLVHCKYDGVHGDWPTPQPDCDAFIWAFFHNSTNASSA
jgi:poly(3-hydroxybutyrate) depolymerase